MVILAVAAALLAAMPAPSLAWSERHLAPVLGASHGAARADLAAKRYGALARRLAGDPRPEVRFLRAVALDAARRPADTVAALDGLEGALPELADRVAFLRGRALEALGRADGAIEAYAAVPDASLRGPAARLARARLLGAAGRAAPALEALAPLRDAPPPAEAGTPDPGAAALLLAGRLAASDAARDPASARAAFLDCWARHPLAPEAPRCLRALRALPGEHGARPPPEQAALRAEALLDANRAGAAASQLRALLPGLAPADAHQPFACRVRASLGRAYRAERRNGAAIELLRPVAERCADPDLRARALSLLGDALAARGARADAISAYRRLLSHHPASPLVPAAAFSAADLLAREGRLAEAADAFAAVARGPPEGNLRDESRFRIAWLAKKAGDTDAAIAHLLEIESDARGRDSYEEARAAYWRARLLAAAGDAGREAARAIWADIAIRFPAAYYGVVARARLREVRDDGEPLPQQADPAPAAAPMSDDAVALEQDPHFRAGVALLRIGLHRAAAEELNAIDPSRLREHGGAPALLVADLLHRGGDARAASLLLRTVARGALRSTPEGRSLRAWRVAYPPAFRRDVARWAPRADVPPDLLHALIREESALDARAVSPAGAVGLTQLMLPTAREVARALRMRPPSRTDLEIPAVSIRIGAHYLGVLVRRFGGSVPLALAAYNAGPGAVARWIEERGHVDVDEFVEEIPYDETRGYVKRVLRSFAAYAILYGAEPDDPLDLQLTPPRLRPGGTPPVSARAPAASRRRGPVAAADR